MATYQGCFADVYSNNPMCTGDYGKFYKSDGRLMPYCTYDDKMTIDKCLGYARDNKAPIFSLQRYRCFLGSDMNLATSLGVSKGCNSTCPGNSYTTCGGSWANALYLLDVTASESNDLGGSESKMSIGAIVGIILASIIVIAIIFVCMCVMCNRSRKQVDIEQVHYQQQQQQQPQPPRPRYNYVLDIDAVNPVPSAPPAPAPPPSLPKVVHHPIHREPDYPPMFLCPITQELMKDPVIATDGHTYERTAIETWTRQGRNVSPMTNVPFTGSTLLPNRNLKSAIATYMGQ